MALRSLIHRDSRLISPAKAAWFAVPLPLIAGFGFVEHGYAKLARGADSFANILQALGLPAPTLLAWATIGVELACGLAVLIGLFILLASVPMIWVPLVAIFTVHLPNGFSSIKLLAMDAAGAHLGQPGYETDLLYLAALIALMLSGSGPFSLDRQILRSLARSTEASVRPLGKPSR